MRELALPVRLAAMVAEAAHEGQRRRSSETCGADDRARARRRLHRSRGAAFALSQRGIARRAGPAVRATAGAVPSPNSRAVGGARANRLDGRASERRRAASSCLAGSRRTAARRTRTVRLANGRGAEIDESRSAGRSALACRRRPDRARRQQRADRVSRFYHARRISDASCPAIVRDDQSVVRRAKPRRCAYAERIRLGAIVFGAHACRAQGDRQADRARRSTPSAQLGLAVLPWFQGRRAAARTASASCIGALGDTVARCLATKP